MDQPTAPTKVEPEPTASPATLSAPTEGGYGKKGSIWKWVIIYVFVAFIVYGGWYLYAHRSGSTTSGTTNSIY